MIKLPCIIEVAEAETVEQAQAALDRFREAVLPSLEYGLTLYRDDHRPFAASVPEHSSRFINTLNGLIKDDVDPFAESLEGYAAAAAAASLLTDWEQTDDGTGYFTARVKRGDVESVIELLRQWAKTLTDTPAQEGQ